MNTFLSSSVVVFRTLLLALCVLISSAITFAQAPGSGNAPTNPGRSAATHSIRGKVFLPSGALPEQRIRVVLEMSTGGIANETFTDSVGNFEFRSISNSTYRVVVPSDGRSYDTTQETVEVYGNLSRTFMVQVYLRDRNAEPVRQPAGKTVSAAEFKQTVPKEAEKLYEKAEKKIKDKKTDEAIVLLQDSLKIFPDYLLALNKLGEQYLIIQRLNESRQVLEKAVIVDSKFPQAHINLGILLFNLKEYKEAISHLETANHLDDGFPMSHLYLGLALMEDQTPDYDRAERELLKAHTLSGKSLVQVRKYLFNLNYRRQDLGKALEQLEAYLKEAPDAPDVGKIRETAEKLRKMAAQKQ